MIVCWVENVTHNFHGANLYSKLVFIKKSTHICMAKVICITKRVDGAFWLVSIRAASDYKLTPERNWQDICTIDYPMRKKMPDEGHISVKHCCRSLHENVAVDIETKHQPLCLPEHLLLIRLAFLNCRLFALYLMFEFQTFLLPINGAFQFC